MTRAVPHKHLLEILFEGYQLERSSSQEKASTLKTGTKRQKEKKRLPSGVEVPKPEEILRKSFSQHAIGCTVAYSAELNEPLVFHSAGFIEALLRLCAEREVEMFEVWQEIDHRIQLGDFLITLNRRAVKTNSASRRVWRPSSTKLP